RAANNVLKMFVVASDVMPCELQQLRPSRVSTRQTQSQHRGLAAGITKSHHLDGWHHAAESLRRFYFRRGGGSKVRSLRHGLRDHGNEGRMSVAMNERPEGHNEVDVFVPIGVPHMRPAAALDHDLTTGKYGAFPRRRITD